MNAQNNKPIVDTVTLPAVGIAGSNQLSISVSCELMKNQRRASPINPSRNIAVVRDSQGQPMIFTIGTDEEFHLLKYEDGSAMGWKVFNLSEGFVGYKATTFAITQDKAGRISIALALSKAKAANTDLFVASMLSDDYAQTDWTKFSSLCKQVSGIDGNFAAEEILMGTSDDGNSSLIVIAGNLKGQKLYYQVEGSDDDARKLEFPENVSDSPDSLIDMSLGYAFGQRGTFFLYKVGETKTLECTTLGTSAEGSEHYDYSPGNPSLPEPFRQLDYNCIATPTGAQTNPRLISSDIYVGAESGIYVFKDARAGSLQKVTDRIKDVHEILVTQDADNISLWALSSADQLYYIYGEKGQTYTWHDPILFSKTVIHIAPMRSQVRKTNELFLVNQDQSLTHHWQDPGSTLWHQRTMKVKDENFILDYNSFTTQIHVEDENGKALTGQKLKVTSSEWVYVEANGLLYSLDKDNPAEIDIDVMGSVTIVVMPTDISTPIFHVDADFFDKTLNVYPNGKIHQGIKAIKTGDDLMNAMTQDGKPVLTQSYDPQTLNGVAGHLSMLSEAGSQFTPGRGPEAYTFVVVEEKGVKHTGRLDLKRVANFTIGMRVHEGQWQAFDVAPSHPSLHAAATFGLFDDFLSFAGDALHAIEVTFEEGIKEIVNGITQLKDGVSFIIQKVEDGFTLIINFAKDKVLKIVLDTVSAVFKAINWVLKLVGIALAKILAWLGHLFGWDDIWETHKVIAAMMKSLLDYSVGSVNAELAQWRSSVDEFFDHLRREIKSLVAPSDLPNTGPRGGVIAGQQMSPDVNLKSPPASWTFYHVQHGGLLAGGTMAVSAGDPFTQFINDVVVPTGKAFASALGQDLSDLERLFTDPSMTYQNVVRFFADLIDTLIEPAKALIDGILRFVRDLLEDFRRLLEGRLDIPFLSSFYEFVTGLLGEEEELTAINAAALLVAIPATFISKIALGRAPFEDSTHGLDHPNLFHDLLDAPQPRVQSQSFAVAGTARALVDKQGDITTSASAETKAAYSAYGGLAGSISAICASIAGIVGLLQTVRESANAKKPSGENESSGEGPSGKKETSGEGESPGEIEEPPDEEGDLAGKSSGEKPKVASFNMAQKIQLACSLGKLAGTFPMPKEDGVTKAFKFRRSAYAISALSPVTSPFIPDPRVRGGILLIADTLTMIMSLVADSLDDASWRTWVADITSNGGGILQGIGRLIPEPRLAAVATAAGLDLGLGAAVFGLTHSIIAISERDLIYLVNVGG